MDLDLFLVNQVRSSWFPKILNKSYLIDHPRPFSWDSWLRWWLQLAYQLLEHNESRSIYLQVPPFQVLNWMLKTKLWFNVYKLIKRFTRFHFLRLAVSRLSTLGSLCPDPLGPRALALRPFYRYDRICRSHLCQTLESWCSCHRKVGSMKWNGILLVFSKIKFCRKLFVSFSLKQLEYGSYFLYCLTIVHNWIKLFLTALKTWD